MLRKQFSVSAMLAIFFGGKMEGMSVTLKRKTIAQFGIGILSIFIAASGWADTFTFNTAGTVVISAADTTYDGHEIVVNHLNAELVIQGSHSFESVELNKGKVTQQGDVTVGAILSSVGSPDSVWAQGLTL